MRFFINRSMDVPLNLTLSLLGMAANILCVLVLNKQRIHSPMNFLFSSLALGDFSGLSIFAVRTIYYEYHETECYSKGYRLMEIIMTYTAGIFIYAFNSWLTLAITVTRFVVVKRMTSLFTIKHAKLIVAVAFIISITQYIPDFTRITVLEITRGGEKCYELWENEDITSKTTFYRIKLTFLLTTYILLMVFSLLIICFFYQGRKRNANITNYSSQAGKWSKTNRSTAILLAVIASSLVSRLSVLLYVIMRELKFWEQNYDIERLILFISDTLTILNSVMNIFFFMISAEFRQLLFTMISCKVTSTTVSYPLRAAPRY